MKSLTVIGILTSSSFAWACPQLAAKYQCQFTEGTKELRVEQRTENNVQVYKVFFEGLEEEFITDGLVRTREHNGETINFKSVCKEEQVIANMESKSDGSVFLTDITVKQKSNRDVTMIYEVREPGTDEPASDEG